jgi:hypothetical protein
LFDFINRFYVFLGVKSLAPQIPISLLSKSHFSLPRVRDYSGILFFCADFSAGFEEWQKKDTSAKPDPAFWSRDTLKKN